MNPSSLSYEECLRENEMLRALVRGYRKEFKKMTAEGEDKNLNLKEKIETELAYLNFRKEHYIPKEKIKQRIKELEPLLDESQNEKIYAELLNDPTIYYMIVKTRVEELKALLPKESINITKPNTVIQNKHIYSDENGIHMEER